MVPPRARVVNVGKRYGRKCITQAEINALLVRFASAGEVVVRLKSGDPSIFARAGEELDALREAAIDIEIIPGVTASLAAAAKLRVSLTDRRRADRLLFVTAHREHGKQDYWHALVNSRTTLAVYMPGEHVRVAEDLCGAGLSESTPCVIVSKVSTPDEQWYRTTVGSLHSAPVMPAPCVLIVGETVRTEVPEKVRSQTLRNLPLQGDFREPSGLPTGP